ncbi:B12-binding domain-containing radical SAM protein [Anaerotruncus rubiinfantis]|uniref:B12-binding domain-containing radical SAM protein n=1 Tax=Anaerotruncus rubiinfantis TaxID=1720200 RepID=UPI0008372FC6|nr:B12-binding domain-containing radical SAM protein [Anaerotruncus rubiinfantis]
MRILLVALNAKFSHTNLAVRYLRNELRAAGFDAEIGEYTINQQPREILADIVARAPDKLFFSCYLWNIRMIRQVGADFRLLFPDTPIVLGGPEVSFDPQTQLTAMPWADAVICGEGEPLVARVAGEKRPRGIYRGTGFADLDALPFPYTDLAALQNRVLYYESSRGCPFGCSYCLSSADRTPRFRSLELVYRDLQRFLDAKVMQVKFVDRTFNLDARRALAIWRYLAEHDNGVTSFQMELGGDLTTGEQLAFLQAVRPGLFQFEIGVQSTCEQALQKICRATDLVKLRENVAAVKAAGNIHQHLDLIAGLPLETFQRFGQSYDEVFSMRPQQLQLGFLKLLRGSSLYEKRTEYGIIHSAEPPYEVLCTPQLSFPELARLKTVEEMTETYYNSGRFSHALDYLLEYSVSPFWTLLALGEGMPARAVGKYEYYERLLDFAVRQGCDREIMGWLMKYDLCLHERPRRLPKGCPMGEPSRPAQYGLPPAAHVETFPFDVTCPSRPSIRTVLVFDYAKRDLFGRAAVKKLE